MTEASTGLRRTATGIFVIGLAVFLAAVYVFLVFWENTIDLGADQITRLDLVSWVILFSILLVLVLVALLVLFFLPGREADAHPKLDDRWQAAEPAPPPPEPEYEQPPAPVYDQEPLPAPEADALAQPVESDAITEALLVRCTNCNTEFELPYSTQRPLQGTCPTCHEDVVLDEGEEVLAESGVDIIDIEGIGPAYARKLRDAGVHTTGQLLVAGTDRLAEQTGIEATLIDTWRSMADLLRVDGVNPQYAELLARTGVHSVDELAQESPSRLDRRIKTYLGSLERRPTDLPVSESRCEAWIQAARDLGAH